MMDLTWTLLIVIVYFHDNHEVIGEVIMTLKPGDKDAIKARMDELTEKRESKQPLEYASARFNL